LISYHGQSHGKNFHGGFSSNRGRGHFPWFGGRNPRYFDHCHRTNHTSDSCWIKHGVPQGSNLHTKVQPPPSKPFAHASMVDIVSSTADLCAEKDNKAEAQFGFSREQYEALLALFSSLPMILLPQLLLFINVLPNPQVLFFPFLLGF